MGVYLGDVTEERARELKLPDVRGVLVGKVAEGSPGEKAGLRENDILLAFNDEKIQNRAHFYHLLTSSSPGSRVQLEISRDGRRRIVSVMLGQRAGGGMTERERLFGEANALLAAANERRQLAEEARQRGDEKSAGKLQDEEKELRRLAEERRLFVENQLREGTIALTNRGPQPETGTASGRINLGVSAIPLSPQLAALFNVAGTGVLITEVQAGELAERAGLRAGDCITRVNGQRVSAPSELARYASAGKPAEADEVVIVFVRDRTEQTVSIKAGKR